MRAGHRRCGRAVVVSLTVTILGKACSTSTGGSCAGYMILNVRIASSTSCIEKASEGKEMLLVIRFKKPHTNQAILFHHCEGVCVQSNGACA